MINITFQIDNQNLKRTDTTVISKNTKNIIKSSFKFTGEIWEGINKFAVFTDSWGEQSVTHLGKMDKCSCSIPNNCLTGTFFKVTVYGGDLVTSNDVTIPVVENEYRPHHKHHHHHCEHEHKDIFVDIFDQLDVKIDTIVLVDNCLQLYSNGELLDSICFKEIIDGETILRKLDELESDVNIITERVENIESALDGKSDVNHTHEFSDINGSEDLLFISEFNQAILDDIDE